LFYLTTAEIIYNYLIVYFYVCLIIVLDQITLNHPYVRPSLLDVWRHSTATGFVTRTVCNVHPVWFLSKWCW